MDYSECEKYITKSSLVADIVSLRRIEYEKYSAKID